jgi:hypothetical protein
VPFPPVKKGGGLGACSLTWRLCPLEEGSEGRLEAERALAGLRLPSAEVQAALRFYPACTPRDHGSTRGSPLVSRLGVQGFDFRQQALGVLADDGFCVLQGRFERLPCGIWGMIGQQCQGVHAHMRIAVFTG